MYRYNVDIPLTCDGASVVVEVETGELASGTERSARISRIAVASSGLATNALR